MWGSRKGQREARRQPRITERMPMRWRAEGGQQSGRGRLRNISISGAMFEARADAPPATGSMLALEPVAARPGVSLPSVARVVWTRQCGGIRRQFLWGLEFVEPAQDVIAALQQKIADRIERIEGFERAKSVIGSILAIIAVVLMAYALFQQGIIRRNMERSYHLMSASASSQAENYSETLGRYYAQRGRADELDAGLQATAASLRETEALLGVVTEEGRALLAEVERLKKDNASLARDLSLVRQDLAAAQEQIVYGADIDSIHNARAAMRAYRDKMNEVRARIRQLRYEARLAHIAAQKERDRIALAQGNRGFIIRDSQPTQPPAGSQATGQKKITVDVSFF